MRTTPTGGQRLLYTCQQQRGGDDHHYIFPDGNGLCCEIPRQGLGDCNISGHFHFVRQPCEQSVS
ncbi:hypothetical protein MJ584_13365 [Klebsiella pneumoniae]|nr:hypothetical protein MJ584_13365 [Klebsiella pneumoniae]